jgi:hypothetical protein
MSDFAVRFSILVCWLVAFSSLATPDLRVEVTTFGCDCLATNSFGQDHFDALNIPSLNGKFLALTTDARRLQIAAQGNVLAVYHNDLNTGWTTNSPAQSAANFNQYTLNNHTSTGPRPDWIAMNEISSSLWVNDPNYRTWLIETMRLMKETYHFNVVLFAPFANPGANGASWTALSNYVYIGVENYLSGEEIKAQNYSVSWCQSQYQSSVNSYSSLGMPQQKLVLTEHFAHTLSGTDWGRSGVTSNEWNQAIIARSKAALNVGFAGYSSYAWVYNHMLVSKEEMIHFEQVYATNPLPTISGITAPYISLGPQTQSALSGSTPTFVVYQAGTNHLNFQWRFNGASIPGATSSSYSITNVQESNEGSYSVALSNSVGVAISSNALLSVHAVFDPFNYIPGSALIGQTNGDGLVWVGAGPVGAAVTVTNGSLDISGATANSILFGYSTGPSARIPIGRTTTSGAIYFSFAFKVLDLGALSSTGGFFASFNNSTPTQPTTPTAIGAAVHTRASGNGFQVGVIKAASGTSVYDTSKVYTTNDTVFVVGRYTVNTSSTTDDEAKLWINPDPATFGAASPPSATLTTTAGNDISANQIASFVFFRRGDSSVQPAAILADELRVAGTWAGVTPVAPGPVDPPPVLIRPIGNKIVLFWPTNATGFGVQTTPALSLTNVWQNSVGTTGSAGPYFSFTNAATNSSLYFRLRK